MADFTIRFLICNLFISGIIVILLTVKRILKHNLSGRMQYNLWLLLLGFLAVPFFPFPIMGFPSFFSWPDSLRSFQKSGAITAANAANTTPDKSTNLITDFALSINSNVPSVMGYILFGIWILGITVMALLFIKSFFRIRALKKSALPLQNPEVCRLYHHCLEELKITRGTGGRMVFCLLIFTKSNFQHYYTHIYKADVSGGIWAIQCISFMDGYYYNCCVIIFMRWGLCAGISEIRGCARRVFFGITRSQFPACAGMDWDLFTVSRFLECIVFA